jgi:hydrogenase maturation protease
MRVRVIGCGNPDAGDDALGILAVRAARASLPDDVEVVEAGVAVQLLHLLDGVEDVIIVDAVRSGDRARPPGTLVHAVASPDGLPAELHGSVSSHGVGVAESVALAAALGPLPRITFLGLEADHMDVGRRLSEPVESALPGLVDAVVHAASITP